ncbi:hypothetical protein CBR_g51124 [Chara braunii]|uniref:Uncharacterized protein n=1 Tax=Chara braunii TaxID=69332 RepID=A0A388K648_CHABU|nr:hypothetical protein CBR_g51124 [Chara braunii]|eukprot:GBG65530.1 hypothetical protein CBR_g51124 [Chara braunii]
MRASRHATRASPLPISTDQLGWGGSATLAHILGFGCRVPLVRFWPVELVCSEAPSFGNGRHRFRGVSEMDGTESAEFRKWTAQNPRSAWVRFINSRSMTGGYNFT